jgi:hypothetical protein
MAEIAVDRKVLPASAPMLKSKATRAFVPTRGAPARGRPAAPAQKRILGGPHQFQIRITMDFRKALGRGLCDHSVQCTGIGPLNLLGYVEFWRREREISQRCPDVTGIVRLEDGPLDSI